MIFIENIFAAIFEDESEAYQAFTEIKNHMLTKNYIIPHMLLIKKAGNRIIPCDGYDAKAYSNDTELGGALDANDLKKAASLITKVSEIFKDGDVGLIAIMQENEGGEFERELTKFKTVIHQKDAAEVAVEVAEAAEFHKEFKAIREGIKIVHDEIEERMK